MDYYDYIDCEHYDFDDLSYEDKLEEEFLRLIKKKQALTGCYLEQPFFEFDYIDLNGNEVCNLVGVSWIGKDSDRYIARCNLEGYFWKKNNEKYRSLTHANSFDFITSEAF